MLCISTINNEAKKDGEYYYRIVGWIDKTNCAYIKDIDSKTESAKKKLDEENEVSTELDQQLKSGNCVVLDFTTDSIKVMSRYGEELKIEWIEDHPHLK